MAKQSKLENVGMSIRDELQLKNDYYNDVANNAVNEYSYTHKDAKSDGDPLGKGTGMSMGFTLPTEDVVRAPGSIDRSNFVTTEEESPTGTVGGKYDIYGYGSLEGKSGRKYLSNINVYNVDSQYGFSSVDTSQNVADGQIQAIIR